MNKFKFLCIGVCASIIFFTSCEDDNDNVDTKTTDNGAYSKGAYISNEGSFSSANASVSFYDFIKDTVYNNLAESAATSVLGDVLQSLYTADSLSYLVLNGSNKVDVVKTSTFAYKATIEGLKMPRYMTVANGKGYISQWVDYTAAKGTVAVIDVTSNTIRSTIEAGAGPEGITIVKNKVWVANGGGFGVDSTLMVIDPVTDQVVKTIVVGQNPKEMVVDKNGDVWVVCYGNIVYNTDYSIKLQSPSQLVKISSGTYQVITSLKIGDNIHPSHIDISKDKATIYFGAGFAFEGIWAVGTDATALPATSLISGYFYSFNVNPANGEIYTCEAPNFTDAGILTRYTATGVKLKSYATGIAPNGVTFR